MDFEDAASHQITVEVTDAAGNSYEESFNINLTDVNESPTDLTLTGGAVAENAVNGTTVGTVRVQRAMIPAGTILTLGRTQIRVDDGNRVEVALHGANSLSGLHGRTPAMRRLMARIERAALMGRTRWRGEKMPPGKSRNR